jgi:hypothetical protein
MQRLPEIGDGVRVPWGLDAVAGEVIDVVPPGHAIVAVPVEGASEEALETTPVRMSIDSLEELPRWRVKRSKKGAAAPGADAVSSWWIDAERDGQAARVEVRVSGSLATLPHGSFPGDVARALKTEGRAAVEKFARRYRLPRVIVLGTHGIFELPQ